MSTIQNCPPGLECLATIERIRCEQLIDCVEVISGYDMNNVYVIRDCMDQQIFYAAEETGFCMRYWCGSQRKFEIHVLDNSRKEVMLIRRELKACAGCFWFASSCDCCAHEATIESPAGQPCGYIRQVGSCWKPAYSVLDENRNEILKIKGPCLIFDGPCAPCINEFDILAVDNISKIGKITKEYGGFFRECSKSDIFGLEMPIDLSIKAKASLFGAIFLIVKLNLNLSCRAFTAKIQNYLNQHAPFLRNI